MKMNTEKITCPEIKTDVEILEKEIANFVNILRRYIEIPDSSMIDTDSVLGTETLSTYMKKQIQLCTESMTEFQDTIISSFGRIL